MFFDEPLPYGLVILHSIILCLLYVFAYIINFQFLNDLSDDSRKAVIKQPTQEEIIQAMIYTQGSVFMRKAFKEYSNHRFRTVMPKEYNNCIKVLQDMR